MAQNKFVPKLTPIINQPFGIAPGMYLILAVVLGVLGLLGVALYLAPQTATLGLVLLGLGLPVLVLLWHRPEFGVIAILFLLADFLPLDLVDIRLPIGGLELRDLLLLGMFGLLIVRGLVRKSLNIPWWPVGAPLTLFMAFVLFSAAYALLWNNVESHWVFAELRDLTAYIIFFITAWSLVRSRNLVVMLIGMFAIADITAAIIIIQQFLSASHPLLPAMTASFWGVWEQGGGIGTFGSVRVVPPSHVLVYFAMLIAGGLAMFEHNRRMRTALVIQFAVLGLALLLTYTRLQWIATAIALTLMVIVFLVMNKNRVAHLALWSIPVLLLALVLLGIGLQGIVAEIPLLKLLSERVATLFSVNETLDSASLQWRVFETDAALKSIASHPLLGVGLGNSYRSLTTLQGEADGWFTNFSIVADDVSRFTRYIHSSYVWLPVKLGIPAALVFFWFCAAFLIAGWQLMRRLPDTPVKGIVLAVLTGFIGLLEWTVLHQHLIMNRSSSALAFVAGLVAAIYALYGRKQGTSPNWNSSSNQQESLNDANAQ